MRGYVVLAVVTAIVLGWVLGVTTEHFELLYPWY